MTAWQAPHAELEEQTIADLRAAMAGGALTSRRLVEAYLERIQALDTSGPTLRAVIEVNPDALAIAEALDQERAAHGPRGPLHGIPILLKDNIDTADKMETTAGSLALVGVRRAQDAHVAARLREAGAVLLGKANMSEWANFRSTHSSSGWSARGGQARNPYALDRSPCGSSSGSASAVAANLCVASVGTETDGSILCPAAINGVVGIKPTVGLTSRVGVIPISHSQDTVGPFARTVSDAAILLGVLADVDPRDSAAPVNIRFIPDNPIQYLNPDALRGARIGIPREIYTGYSEKVDAVFATVVETLKSL
ncbi:MAG TPA: amidase family protein, partial [Ktedonobacterales bacterium]|nr:amidase family protein [Ktedonobacterales bacterium]